MQNNPNGCEAFMAGLRALGDGFGFFFRGLWIALQIWYAKAVNWFCRPIEVPQWGMLVGAAVISFGVLSVQHIAKMDFSQVEIALVKADRLK